MNKLYKNNRTESVYRLVYTTPITPALPQSEKLVVLECVINDKLMKASDQEFNSWSLSDQEFITLPTELLNRYFVEFPITREDD